MKELLKKLTSRKFLITCVTMLAGIALALKDSGDEKLQAIGFIIAGVSALVYMIVEGNIDAQRVKIAVDQIIQGATGNIKPDGPDFIEDAKAELDESSKEESQRKILNE